MNNGPGYMNAGQADALNMQQQDLQSQLAAQRARGLPTGQKFDTWGGAALGGIGNTLQAISGKSREMRLAEALADNAKQRQSMFGGGAPPMVGP